MDSVAHGKVVLAAVFRGKGSIRALDYAGRYLSPDHFEDRTQRALFTLAQRYADQTRGILPRHALEDLLRSYPAGTAQLYTEYYDHVASRSPSLSDFRHSVAQLRELRQEEATGRALAQARAILGEGATDERGREVRGHAAARAHVVAAFADIEREAAAGQAPEGDIRLETARLHDAYARARERRMSGNTAGVGTGIARLDEVLSGGLSNGEFAMVAGFSSAGKAQPLDAPVLTPDGWREMGNLRPGDLVIDPAGQDSVVLAVHPQGRQPVYRVTFSDGSSCEATADHLWQVEVHRNRKLPGGRRLNRRRAEVLTTEQLREWLLTTKMPPRLPPIRPPEFTEKPLPVDPYLLGLLLGDGCLVGTSPEFGSADPELLEACRELLPAGMSMVLHARRGAYESWLLVKSPEAGFFRSPLNTALRELGLLGKRSWEKAVPVRYLLASATSRLAVLQGLMDTDGYGAYRHGCAGFSSASQQLRDDVVWLARSLGLTAWTSEKETAGRRAYLASIRETAGTRVFRLARKKAPAPPPRDSRLVRSVELVREAACQCISVSAASRLYVTEDFIPTHNSQWVAHQAWHASIMQGKNVVLFASETTRDNMQVRIVGRHSRLPKFGLQAGLNTRDIRAGTLDGEQYRAFRAVLADYASDSYRGRCYIVQLPRGATMGTAEARLAAISRQFDPDIVIIDYLALLRPDRPSGERRDDLTLLLQDAKQLSVTFKEGRGVPVLSPWQVNRSGRTEVAARGYYTFKDLAETAEAERSPDVIISLLDPEQDDSRGRKVPLRLDVMKNREAERFVRVELLADFANSYFAPAGSADDDALLAPLMEDEE